MTGCPIIRFEGEFSRCRFAYRKVFGLRDDICSRGWGMGRYYCSGSGFDPLRCINLADRGDGIFLLIKIL